MTVATRPPRLPLPRSSALPDAPVAPHRRISGPRGESTGAFWLLLAVVTVLNMTGLIMVLSSSSVISLRKTGSTWSYFERQAVWTMFGLIALTAFLYVDLNFWRRHTRIWLGIAIALLAAVLVPGVGVKVNGSTRWLGAGPLQVQPSEFAKFAMLLFVAELLGRRDGWMHDIRFTLLPVLLYLGLVVGLIMLEPNLGTTIVLAVMVLVMLYAAGTPTLPLACATLLGALAGALSVASTPFRRARFFAFLDPWKDPGNTGYQIIQAMVGTADGGLLGEGLGASRAKWGFLPYAHTDFIFAIIGEEFGLVGCVLVIALFLSLGGLGAFVASRAKTRFETLVATGITAWLMVQALVNIGAVIGRLPITGVPLPFISFGGSSLLVNLAAIGLLLNIAREPAPPPTPARRRS